MTVAAPQPTNRLDGLVRGTTLPYYMPPLPTGTRRRESESDAVVTLALDTHGLDLQINAGRSNMYTLSAIQVLHLFAFLYKVKTFILKER